MFIMARLDMDGKETNIFKLASWNGTEIKKPEINESLVSFLEEQLKLAKEGRVLIHLQASIELDEQGGLVYTNSIEKNAMSRTQSLAIYAQLDILKNRFYSEVLEPQ